MTFRIQVELAIETGDPGEALLLPAVAGVLTRFLRAWMPWLLL